MALFNFVISQKGLFPATSHSYSRPSLKIKSKSRHFQTFTPHREWWLIPESNQGHKDFQSSALPTELMSHKTSVAGG